MYDGSGLVEYFTWLVCWAICVAYAGLVVAALAWLSAAPLSGDALTIIALVAGTLGTGETHALIFGREE